MKVRPLQDRVIVERAPEETKTSGGIVIPNNAAEKPAKGKVLAVGPGKRTSNGEICALDVKVGDQILFGKYAGTEIKIDDKEYIVMREDDIMAILV
ncbi:MAG: co-chaperone GroES [Gammaproteobacteria bacterium]